MTSKHTLDLEKDKFALDGSVRVNAEGAGGGGKTSYDAADITALGASTDVNLWLAAKADGMLIKQYTSTWDNADEAITYYTHPDLGDGDYCLKILKIYTDDNSNRVLASETPSVVTWNFDNDLAGIIALTLGAVTSPSADSLAGTQVCSVSFTESGDIGTYQLSLVGANSSSYRFNNITQGTTGTAGGSITALITDSVVIETAVDFGNITYSHSTTVSLTELLTAREDTASFSTSGTAVIPFSNEFYAQGNATTSSYADFRLVGTEKSLFPSLGGGTNLFPDWSDSWCISFWLYPGSGSYGSGARECLIKQQVGTAQGGLQVFMRGTSDIEIYYAGTTAGNYVYAAPPASALTYDAWNHVIINHSGNGNLYMYIDNGSVGSNGSTGVLSTVDSQTSGAAINETDILTYVHTPAGGTAVFRANVDIRLDNLICFNTDLDAAKRTELYNGGETIRPSDLSFSSNVESFFSFGDGPNDDVVNGDSFDHEDSSRYFEIHTQTANQGLEQLTMDDSIYYSAIGNHKYISSASEWSLIGGDVSGSTMPTGDIGAYQNLNSSKHLFGGANANASIAVSLWFNQTGTPNGTSNMLVNTVIVNSSDTTKSVKWGLLNYTNDRIYVTRVGVTYDPNYYVTNVTSNTWHHVVVSYSSINSTTYFEEVWYDGTFMGVQTLNKSDVPYIWDMTGYTNYGFSINSAFHNSDSHSPFGGYGNLNTVPVKVDQVATFNKSLSNSEVIAIFNNGTPTDLSNHNGIVHYFTMGDGDNDTGTSIECQIESGVTLTSTTDYTQNH